jgi:hypothetical protein
LSTAALSRMRATSSRELVVLPSALSKAPLAESR